MKKLIIAILLLTCVAFGAELKEPIDPNIVEPIEIVLSPTKIATITDSNEIEITETKKTVYSKDDLLEKRARFQDEIDMVEREITFLEEMKTKLNSNVNRINEILIELGR